MHARDFRWYGLPLTADQSAARLTRPVTSFGAVVSLEYLPDKLVREMEPKWREWCSKYPRAVWPDWIDRWKDVKRRRGL